MSILERFSPAGRFMPQSELIAALTKARGPMDRRTETGGILASGREQLAPGRNPHIGPVTGAPVTNGPGGRPVHDITDPAGAYTGPNVGQVAAGNTPPPIPQTYDVGGQTVTPNAKQGGQQVAGRLNALLAMLGR